MNFINQLLSQRENDFNARSVQSLLIGQKWLLVNKIKDTKINYYFHEDNVLERITDNAVSKSKWYFVNDDYIRITNQDDSIDVIKMAFRNEDILTLDIDRKSKELAVFINETSSDTVLNSYEDITDYLHKKYLNKAKTIIYNHYYFYIKESVEFGPFTAKELIDKTIKGRLSAQCFIRETNDNTYNKRLRIQDLIDAV